MPEKGIKRLLGEALPEPSNANGFAKVELYIRVESPEVFLKRALEQGAKELSPIQPRDWGDRAGYVLDTDGNVIAFASPIISKHSDLDHFFKQYGTNFLNPEALTGFYGDCAMMAAPSFVGCIRGKDEISQAIKSVTEYQQKTGMRSLTPTLIKETSVDDHHRWAKVKWAATFEKTGDRLISFEISYLVRTEGGQNKILFYVSHQDEQKLRAELGVS